jgi:acetyl-CoA acetyltransferase
MSAAARQPVIVGSFDGPSGKTGQPAGDLYVAAAVGALADAQIGIGEVDALLTSYSWEAPVLMHADFIAERLGAHPTLTETVCLGGASPCAMVGRAAAAVRAGACDVVVLSSASNRASGLGRQAAIDALREVADPLYEVPFGAFVPALYALVAGRYMHDYGATPAQLARVASDQRAYAANHPQANMREAITIEDVLRSPVIASPLRMLDCCLVTDFCAGLVITTLERAQRMGRPAVPILGYGEAHTHLTVSQAPDAASEGGVASANAAYAQAGLGPAHIGFAQLYDCFTITVLLTLEDLGLCPKGTAGAFVESGAIGAQGSLPVNTNGGMLSYATGGMYHIVEAVAQLRGTAGDRQIDDPGIGIVTGVGGVLSARCTVILGEMVA